jgi:hypothetical protein
MAALTLLFGLFAAGYAFEDPGGWQAVGMTMVVVAPLVLLTFVAYRWPQAATWLLAAGTVLVAVVAVIDAAGQQRGALLEEFGPVVAVNVLMLGLPMAMLGLHRPLVAALLIGGTALAVYLPSLPFVLQHGISLGASVSWSSSVLVVPFLVIAAVFGLAALLNRGEAARKPPAPLAPQPPVRAGV